MPFRFKKKESVAEGVRRLCCERLDDVLQLLEDGKRLEVVHHVRKEIKKLRAILRLTRGKIGESVYSENNGALREAAHLLTPYRDAQVKLSAFDDLTRHYKRKLPAKSCRTVRGALTANRLSAERKLAGSMDPLKRILCESKTQFGKLDVGAHDWKALAPGLKKSYAAGRRAYQKLKKQSSATNFHQWRKRVKDLGYDLRLLAPANPRRLGARKEKLKKLGELLGDDHDLVMLKKFVAGKFPRGRHTARLESCITLREKKLRAAALKLGGRFYHEKPGHFCRRLRGYWKDWRGKR